MLPPYLPSRDVLVHDELHLGLVVVHLPATHRHTDPADTQVGTSDAEADNQHSIRTELQSPRYQWDILYCT